MIACLLAATMFAVDAGDLRALGFDVRAGEVDGAVDFLVVGIRAGGEMAAGLAREMDRTTDLLLVRTGGLQQRRE